MSNLSDLLPSGAGGKSFDFVASGTLASGQAVGLTSDGKVTAITGFLSSTVVYEAANSTYNRVAYDSTNNKIVIAYQDEGNSQYLTSVVGTIASGAITFGTPVVIVSSAGLGYDSLTFNASSGKVVYSFSPANNSYYGTAIVGTVSGTSISWGTSSVFASTTTANIASTYDSTAQKVLIFYRGTSNYGYGITTTISGTSISFGAQSTFNSAVTTNIHSAYNSTQNKTALIYRDAASSFYGRSIVATVSGTSLSYGTPVALTSDAFSSTRGNAALVYDLSKDKIVASWRSSANAGVGAIGTISGTSISWGSAVTIKASGATHQTLVYDSVQNTVYSQMQDAIVPLTISGTSFTVGTATNLSTTNLDFVGAAFDVNAKVIVYAYRDNSNSSHGTSVLYNPLGTANDDFVGITEAAIANTATGTVTLQGGINTKVTGLTVGSTYYVQDNGTLGTSSTSIVAGEALSATSINLVNT